MIVHIPHDGRWMPYGLSDFDGTVTPLRDFGARQVFEGGTGQCLVFPVDRLVCDVERFKDGEPMESVGMGICYERNADLGHLRDVSPELREAIIQRFYDPHHRRLEQMVDHEIETFGRCLVIDGHTFSAVKRGYEPASERPQIDIGHDGDEPSMAVADVIIGVLGEWYDIMVNAPFAGSIRPLSRLHDGRVASVMIEVRQDLDMELARERIQEAMRKASEGFYRGACREATSQQDAGSRWGGFSSAERHRRLDAIAEKYQHMPAFQDLVYEAWDDDSLGSDGLMEIERQATLFA